MQARYVHWVSSEQALDAAQNGSVECAHTTSFFYTGKNEAFAIGTGLPFGLNTRQQNAWMYEGGGIELMNELYRKFNVHGLPCGATGAQMGGWFRREVNTAADLQGLKMRIGGLAGQVLARLGGVPQQLGAADQGGLPVEDHGERFVHGAQRMRAPRLGLERMYELQRVLLGDHVLGDGGEAAEELKDGGPFHRVHRLIEVLDRLGGIGVDARPRLAAEAHLVERLLEERIEGGGDEEPEGPDRGELLQRGRNREGRGVGEHLLQAGVDVLDLSPARKKPAGHRMQRAGRRQVFAGNLQIRGQALGEERIELHLPAFDLGDEEIRADDGHGPALLDELEELIPEARTFAGCRRHVERGYARGDGGSRRSGGGRQPDGSALLQKDLGGTA